MEGTAGVDQGELASEASPPKHTPETEMLWKK